MSALAPNAPIRTLRRCSGALSIFPGDVALILGRMAARLSSVLGPDLPAPRRQGVPEGYDGVSRRGGLEQLLLSEWALLDTAPDELLRRLSQGELSYLRRAHRAPHSDAVTLALFDVGPGQLGAPRLVHLALLVVLAERAARRGGRLWLGALQSPPSERHEALEASQLRAQPITALLATRAHRPATREDLSRWFDALEREAPALDERFVVGAPFVEPKCVHVGIEESLEVAGTLTVAVRSPRAPRRELALELPRERDALRVLRDPFAAPEAPRVSKQVVRIDPSVRPVFSGDGQRVYLGGGAGVTQIQVPNSPRAQSGPPVYLPTPAGHEVVAVGRTRRRGRRAVMITALAGAFYVHIFGKRGGSAQTSRRLEVAPDVTLGPSTARTSMSVVAWRDQCSWFVTGDALLGVRDYTIVSRHTVAATAAVDGAIGLGCIARKPSGAFVHHLALPDGKVTVRPVEGGAARPHRRTVWSGPLPFPYAVAVTSTRYALYPEATSDSVLEVATGDQVMAVAQGGLVLLDSTLTQVSLLSPSTPRRALFSTARRIVSLVVSPSGANLCAVTEGGEVVLYGTGALLSRIAGEVP